MVPETWYKDRGADPFDPVAEGLRVALRVQPGTSRSRIDGSAKLDDGRVVLKVRVTEPPENGKANAAVLTKTWKMPKSSLRVIAGHGGRRKTLLVAGQAAELLPRLRAWLAALDDDPRCAKPTS